MILKGRFVFTISVSRNYFNLVVKLTLLLLFYYLLDSVGVKVGDLWVPSQNKIPGNEIADALARSATDGRSCRGVTTTNLQLSICEVK